MTARPSYQEQQENRRIVRMQNPAATSMYTGPKSAVVYVEGSDGTRATLGEAEVTDDPVEAAWRNARDRISAGATAQKP